MVFVFRGSRDFTNGTKTIPRYETSHGFCGFRGRLTCGAEPICRRWAEAFVPGIFRHGIELGQGIPTAEQPNQGEPAEWLGEGWSSHGWFALWP
jgi:hypothetical protein